MADPKRRLPTNVDGDSFVDETCIDCGACRWMAPAVFDHADGASRVFAQPDGEAARHRALQALVASFPDPIGDGVYHCGFHDEASFGAASYLVVRPAGNVLVDVPRFHRGLLRRIEELGGVDLMFLTHREDVAHHDRFAAHFGCERVMHGRHRSPRTADVERWIEGDEAVTLADDPPRSRGAVPLPSGEDAAAGGAMRRVDAPRGVRVLVAAVAVALTTFASAPACAQTTAPDWAFGHPGGEVGLALGSALSLSTLLLPQRQGSWAPSTEGVRDDDFGGLSDVTGNVIGSGLLATTHFGLEVSHYDRFGVPHAGLRALRTSLVDAEAFMLSMGVTSALKALVGRCRPRAYHEGRCGPEPEHDAFPSGHATPVAAIAGVQLTMALRSDPVVPQRWAMLGVAEGMSLATATLRVLAGAHSWEDVLAGWAIGHLSGALVQLAHPMEQIGQEPGSPPTTAATSPLWLSYGGRF